MLRIIAIDRAIHFVVLVALAVAVFLFAAHEVRVRDFFYRIVNAVQGSSTGPAHASGHGFLHTLEHLFTLKSSTLYAVAAVAAVYAVLEGVEAVGLWYQKRWAEYLTLIATVAFIPYEIYELTLTVSPFKLVAFCLNVAIAVYLLYAKRLFGVRGGGAAEERETAARCRLGSARGDRAASPGRPARPRRNSRSGSLGAARRARRLPPRRRLAAPSAATGRRESHGEGSSRRGPRSSR